LNDLINARIRAALGGSQELEPAQQEPAGAGAASTAGAINAGAHTELDYQPPPLDVGELLRQAVAERRG
jgi:hypothetical protein